MLNISFLTYTLMKVGAQQFDKNVKNLQYKIPIAFLKKYKPEITINVTTVQGPHTFYADSDIFLVIGIQYQIIRRFSKI